MRYPGASMDLWLIAQRIRSAVKDAAPPGGRAASLPRHRLGTQPGTHPERGVEGAGDRAGTAARDGTVVDAHHGEHLPEAGAQEDLVRGGEIGGREVSEVEGEPELGGHVDEVRSGDAREEAGLVGRAP